MILIVDSIGLTFWRLDQIGVEDATLEKLGDLTFLGCLTRKVELSYISNYCMKS